jgi:hypothetical protein
MIDPLIHHSETLSFKRRELAGCGKNLLAPADPQPRRQLKRPPGHAQPSKTHESTGASGLPFDGS